MLLPLGVNSSQIFCHCGDLLPAVWSFLHLAVSWRIAVAAGWRQLLLLEICCCCCWELPFFHRFCYCCGSGCVLSLIHLAFRSGEQSSDQISLGGRIISAHKRQLKIPTDSRRQSARRFVFSGESPSTAVQPCSSKNANSNNNKRKRDDDGESEDSDSDFYGFAADSFLFGEENVSARDFWANQDAVMSDPRSDRDEVTGSAPALEMETHVGLSDLPVKRRSKRSTKKRRKDDYMYY